MYNVNCFIVKQDEVYDSVLKEFKNGKKVSHWMWYIFPQLLNKLIKEIKQSHIGQLMINKIWNF